MTLSNNSDAVDESARSILLKNDKGQYTVPTEGLYPYQWNWDSAFAAFGIAQFDVGRAWAEMHTLFSGQWNDGMVPHILFHQIDEQYFPGPDIWGCDGPIPSSGISQPPVAATFVRKIYERDHELGLEHLAILFPKIVAWHRWFMNWRAEDGMICINHPWESGRDNAPDWDAVMESIDPVGIAPYTRRDTTHVDPHMRPTKYDYDRYIWLVEQGRNCGWDQETLKAKSPFRIADPTMSFILLRANRDLLALAAVLGQDDKEIQRWIALQEQGVSGLWNSEIGCYDSFDIRSRTFAGSISNASFLCWYGGIKDQRMLAHFDRIMAGVKYGVPSHDPESQRFDRKRYWRGPSWAPMNTLIGMGLEASGEIERAELVRSHTREAISDNGFAEYFDPFDGAPAGGGSFTWTASVWLAWAGQKARMNNGRD